MQPVFESTIEFARQKDREDTLRSFRSRFYFPPHHKAGSSGDAIYFCANSLGLQPKDAEPAIQQELKYCKEIAIGGKSPTKNTTRCSLPIFQPPPRQDD